ncbi:regulatory protein RecX [uncultured Bacteroides sp.]|uniref:regulatory protein RecX n=1 Tax=uncultured Bacteroides sp. TaxID=162156 RepID=UPI002AA66903|nr:regulatory protein RecX [uncultured Bacteroides sp.]
MNTLTEQEALSRLAFYCSTAEHCRSEINDKLHKWGIESDAIERILNRLETEKYIDDERYCRSFVNDKFHFAKWGKMKISQALYQKKIPSTMISEYLCNIDEEQYLITLRHLLNTKSKNIRAKNSYDLKAKLIRFGISRGFEMKDIRRCIDLSDMQEWE